MIASLRGRLDRSDEGEIVVDVGGVGYLVKVPASTQSSLPAPGEECSIRIVTVVREDEISLFGFATDEEENLFRLLQSVSGVGPKLALKILSGIAAADLGRALASGDFASLTMISGVGKKLAQRLVVELKDKAAPLQTAAPKAGGPSVEAQEALDALKALGYTQAAATKALEKARSAGASNLQDLVREALRSMAPKATTRQARE